MDPLNSEKNFLHPPHTFPLRHIPGHTIESFLKILEKYHRRHEQEMYLKCDNLRISRYVIFRIFFLIHYSFVNLKLSTNLTLSNKGFATLTLTVFAQDNSRVGLIFIFKGKGQVSSKEKDQYAPGVNVGFTPKGVINGSTTDRYVQLWWSKV